MRLSMMLRILLVGVDRASGRLRRRQCCLYRFRGGVGESNSLPVELGEAFPTAGYSGRQLRRGFTAFVCSFASLI